MEYLKPGESLDKEQKEVISECLQKKKGAMCLAMGFGKTLISLIVALEQTKDIILVVCSKSLVSAGWEFEINKFFKKTLVFQTLKSINSNFVPKENVRVIIVTPEILKKCYNTMNLKQRFVTEEEIVDVNRLHFGGVVNVCNYQIQDEPFLPESDNGLAWFYSRKFGALIVDEAQRYTKITTQKCQAICTISSKHTWLLSGTMFSEPSPVRILGYYLMLHDKKFPKNVYDTAKLLKSNKFRGLSLTAVVRTENKMFKVPKINRQIISHELSQEEGQLYLAMKSTLQHLRNEIKRMKYQAMIEGRVNEDVKKFSSYLLTMITYLRQGIVCPIIPISNISLDVLDFNNKSELSQILNQQFASLGLENWLNNENSVCSSRIKKIIETIDKHPNEKIVIFSCFRTSIDILKHYIKRKVYLFESKMSQEKRAKVLEEFKKDSEPDSILITTYDLGSDGLNLQCAHVVIIMDFFWNHSTTNQAIARVLRYGQLAKEVFIYLFTSNTGIERALFHKQQDKLAIAEELMNGAQKTVNRTIKIDDILRLIDAEENNNLIKNLSKTKR